MDMSLGLSDPMIPRDAAHGNPMFQYLTAFVPRKLRDLFRWGEYLSADSPHVYALARKFGEYPITKLVYETTKTSEREKRKELYEHHMNLKGAASMVSFDRLVYGNVFLSVYEPFKRFLICSSCKNRTAIDSVPYSYNADQVLFRYKCPKCRVQTTGRIFDEKLKEYSKIKIIRWDPKLIDIDHNPITDDSAYYYTIPRDVIARIRGGSKQLINGMPQSILKTIAKRATLRFHPDSLYHMKVPGPSGIESQWGFPPITSTIKLFLFAAILRKANEAIALEHITPFRVMFPQAGSGMGDPIATINLNDWKSQIESQYRQFRQDPLRIAFSPTPIGVQNIGGEGRALLTLGELQEAEKTILLAFGVPPEFIQGGFGQRSGEQTLRMVENQLQTHIEALNGFLQWTERRCSQFFGWPEIRVRLSDFKLVDDVERKQLLLQLWSQAKVSDTTIYETFEIDADHERKQRIQDTLDDARAQQQLEREMNELQSSLSQQVQQQSAMNKGQGLNYDPAQVIAQADQLVQEMLQYDEGTRRSRMDALQGEDPVMYAVVKDRLEQQQQNQVASMKAQTMGTPPQPMM